MQSTSRFRQERADNSIKQSDHCRSASSLTNLRRLAGLSRLCAAAPSVVLRFAVSVGPCGVQSRDQNIGLD
eukprot:5359649-Amphidinium_carterae.2